jgi:hypothetical protein
MGTNVSKCPHVYTTELLFKRHWQDKKPPSDAGKVSEHCGCGQPRKLKKQRNFNPFFVANTFQIQPCAILNPCRHAVCSIASGSRQLQLYCHTSVCTFKGVKALQIEDTTSFSFFSNFASNYHKQSIIFKSQTTPGLTPSTMAGIRTHDLLYQMWRRCPHRAYTTPGFHEKSFVKIQSFP